jgi:hypothetical protein
MRATSIVAIVMSVAACIPHPLGAQAPRLEVSAGYAVMRDNVADLSFPRGWLASAAVGVYDWLSVVVEVASSNKVLTAAGGDLHFRVLSAMAGAKASRRSGRLTEFGQFLVGSVNGRAHAFDVSSSHTMLAIQAGVGLDYAMTRRLGARLQVDGRRTGSSDTGIQAGFQFRAGVGIAVTVR